MSRVLESEIMYEFARIYLSDVSSVDLVFCFLTVFADRSSLLLRTVRRQTNLRSVKSWTGHLSELSVRRNV